MRRQARVVSGPASWAMRFFAVHNTAMMGAGQFQPPLEALVAGVAREHWTEPPRTVRFGDQDNGAGPRAVGWLDNTGGQHSSHLLLYDRAASLRDTVGPLPNGYPHGGPYVVLDDLGPAGGGGEHISELFHQLRKFLPLGRTEFFAPLNLRPGRSLGGSEAREPGDRLNPPLEQVDVVDLLGLSPPWLVEAVIDGPHLLSDCVGALPGGQELAGGRGDQDQDTVSRLEFPRLGRAVVGPLLAHLGFLHMFTDNGGHCINPLLHLLHILNDRAVRGGLLLPGLPHHIEKSPGPAGVK
ncbi:hypothetical protein MHYP_G00349840 [Metynnis hypsauchen]